MGSDEIRAVRPDRIRGGPWVSPAHVNRGSDGHCAVPRLCTWHPPWSRCGPEVWSFLSGPRGECCPRAVGESLEKRWRPGTLGPSVPTDGGWEIRLCGPIEAAHEGGRIEDGIPGRQGRLLFAYLVRQRDRVCSRSELIDTLWPEHPPAAADTALSALLSKLRRTLGDGVVGGRGGLQLRLGPNVDVDADRAEAEATAAEAALERGDWPAALAHGRAATGVDGASFLADCDGPWLHEQRRELDTIRLRGLEAVAVAGLRHGGRELQSAEQAARAAIAMAPFRESAHILLMEVHEAAGNPAEALRAFEELRSLLREELGTTPGPAAMSVFERVLRGEPPPVHRSLAAVAGGPWEVASWPPPLAAAVDRHALVGRGVELAYLERCW